jgi:nucleoside-diphosphate-sugar epimerase
MKNQRRNAVLVTGAQGFLGRAVSGILQHSGSRVIALDSLSSDISSSSETASNVVCDITNKSDLEAVFHNTRIGGIVHLAAILPTAAQRDPIRATHVNIVGSVNLLELARRFRVPRFVFGSSLSIYGSCPAERVISETDRTAPEDVYGAAKLHVEQVGSALATSSGLEFVSLRIGRVVGPGARSTTSAWRSEIFELLSAEASGNIALPYTSSERVLLVHMEDAARALVTLLDASRPRHAIYNAPCESWEVQYLKNELESLNPKLRVTPGDAYAKGNPRLLDASRFQNEFRFATPSLTERLRAAAGR